MHRNNRHNVERVVRPGARMAARYIAAGLIMTGIAAAPAWPANAQDVAVPYPATSAYPMMGMMAGGCLAMGWGGPMMTGPGFMMGAMPGTVQGVIPFGMMGWSNGYGGSSSVYQGMMGGTRIIQNSVVTGNMPPKGMGPQMMAGGPALLSPRPEAVLEGRLAYLHAELGITDAEHVTWDAYAVARRAQLGRMQEMYQRLSDTVIQGGVTGGGATGGDATKGDAIAHLDAHIAVMEKMLEILKAIRPAVDGLYKVLNDDQKRLADQLLGADCNGM